MPYTVCCSVPCASLQQNRQLLLGINAHGIMQLAIRTQPWDGNKNLTGCLSWP
jgi:hypothetical protein